MNLLFLFSDQHSKHFLGCYGNPHVHTPNLDRLAQRGVVFDNAYCNNPLCVPSRASMTIGDYAFRGSYWDNAHGYVGAQKSWGHRLNESGIKMTTIGKLHFVDARPETGFLDQRVPLHMKNGTGDVTMCIKDPNARKHALRQIILDAGAGNAGYYSYDCKVAELSAKYLREEAPGMQEPWCLYSGFVTPHFPLQVPQRYLDLYDASTLPMPIDWEPENWMDHPAVNYLRTIHCFAEPFTEEQVKKAMVAYYALCTFLDEQLGVVLDALEESGLAEDTRVIYSTDHGESIGEHGLWFKETLNEGSVAVPLIVAGPGIPAGERVKQGVSLVDIYPTVLDNFDIQPDDYDKSLPGTSLYAFIDGRCTEERVVFSEGHANGIKTAAYMAKYGPYKYNYYVGDKPQLFNLETDPNEEHDLCDDLAYQDVRKSMDKKLRSICDPEKVYEQCCREQEAMVNANGGRDKVLQTVVTFSPPPKV